MLRFVVKKIKNKMWLTVCLVIGISFLVATLSCQPMFKAGSLDKLLNNIFEEHIKEVNEYPTAIGRSGGYAMTENITADAVMSQLESMHLEWV